MGERAAGRALNVGSVFSGIGGFDLAFARAGMTIAWQCEIDRRCREVLRRWWPDVPCLEDVRDVRGADVPTVDVLCGGFPCQDLSVAGRRAGLAGTRSGLWWDTARWSTTTDRE
jgi:DNA (cytosine-5)-methyltransferase 1